MKGDGLMAEGEGVGVGERVRTRVVPRDPTRSPEIPRDPRAHEGRAAHLGLGRG